MKNKPTIFGLFFALAIGLVLFSPQTTLAATVAECSIVQVNQDMGAGGVTLAEVNGIFTKTFLFYSPASKEMLAVALTAVSLGKNVIVRIQDNELYIDRIRMSGN